MSTNLGISYGNCVRLHHNPGLSCGLHLSAKLISGSFTCMCARYLHNYAIYMLLTSIIPHVHRWHALHHMWHVLHALHSLRYVTLHGITALHDMTLHCSTLQHFSYLTSMNHITSIQYHIASYYIWSLSHSETWAVCIRGFLFEVYLRCKLFFGNKLRHKTGNCLNVSSKNLYTDWESRHGEPQRLHTPDPRSHAC